MKKIVIADDQPEVRELVRVTLEIGSYEIHEASNGVETLELVRRLHPDMLLLDIMMPDGPDGLEVCQQLKSDPQYADMPIIMLTAKGQDADWEAGWAAGADEYFTKPFSPLELIHKVESTLNGN